MRIPAIYRCRASASAAFPSSSPRLPLVFPSSTPSPTPSPPSPTPPPHLRFHRTSSYTAAALSIPLLTTCVLHAVSPYSPTPTYLSTPRLCSLLHCLPLCSAIIQNLFSRPGVNCDIFIQVDPPRGRGDGRFPLMHLSRDSFLRYVPLPYALFWLIKGRRVCE
jgi:hypothetical protein